MKNTNNKQVKSQGIKNPTETIAAKILIWVLLGVMILIPFASLILLLI